MLIRILAVLIFASAAAVPLAAQQGSVDLVGELTFIEDSAFPFYGLEVGDDVRVQVRLDLLTPPTQAGPDALRYPTLPFFNRIYLRDLEILDGSPPMSPNLLVVDGDGGLSDAMAFEQPITYNLFGSSAEGRAVLLVDGQGSDAWMSPDLTTLPPSLVLGAPGGPGATLSVFDGTNVEIATAVFSGLEIEVSGEAGCAGYPNSTGVSGRVRGLGSRVAADNTFELQAYRLPLDSFGYFIVGPQDGYIQFPGGQPGAICMTGPIGRFVGPGEIRSSGPSGTITLPVDLDQVPTTPGFETVTAGETRYFQLWHRDLTPNGPSSNFTESAVISFL